MAFKQVRPKVNFPELEGEILRLWERIGAFEKSVEQRKKDNPFVFYEGPPTANGRPGFHHALARAFKDLIPRYKTMRGYRVERKGGWDCHGLPVELQVEKELGLAGKHDVEEYGVEEFNRLCRESVYRYVEDWREMSARLGFWVDMDDAYWTLELLHRERLVGLEDPLRTRSPLRRLQGHRSLPPRPDLPLLGRSRDGLRARHRPERLREAPARGRGEHEPPYLDYDAVDAYLQHRRRGESRCRVRGRRRGRRAPDPGARATGEGFGRRRPSGRRDTQRVGSRRS